MACQSRLLDQEMPAEPSPSLARARHVEHRHRKHLPLTLGGGRKIRSSGTSCCSSSRCRGAECPRAPRGRAGTPRSRRRRTAYRLNWPRLAMSSPAGRRAERGRSCERRAKTGGRVPRQICTSRAGESCYPSNSGMAVTLVQAFVRNSDAFMPNSAPQSYQLAEGVRGLGTP